MLNKIIHFSIRNKLIIGLFTLTLVAFGIFSLTRLSVGAVPDITNNQVQVITTSRNLSTEDMEQFITYPVELEMANLPGVLEIRSISRRSEEHTSELQSRPHLVCRLLLEKKKTN